MNLMFIEDVAILCGAVGLLFVVIFWGIPALGYVVGNAFYWNSQLKGNPFSYAEFVANCDYLTSGIDDTNEFYLEENHGLFSNGILLKKDWNLVETRNGWNCLKRLV